MDYVLLEGEASIAREGSGKDGNVNREERLATPLRRIGKGLSTNLSVIPPEVSGTPPSPHRFFRHFPPEDFLHGPEALPGLFAFDPYRR